MKNVWFGFPLFSKFPLEVVKNRKKFYTLSIVVILIGFLFMGINYARYQEPLNLGVDFSGGVVFTVTLPEDKDASELTRIALEAGVHDPIVRKSGANEYELRAKIDEATLPTVRESLQASASVNDENFVGPSVASSLLKNAVLSLTVALLALLVYISVRFRLKYGLAAVLALVHDVLVTISIFAIFFIPMNSPFVAVLLILVGYSLQDSIVVLDRVRENRKLNSKASTAEVVESAIHSVFRRSLNTSITTLIAALCLMIFVYRFLPDFTTGLTVGLITGTYSSIFIAASLLVDWGE